MSADHDGSSARGDAFNFSRAGLLTGDQLRTLRTLDEQFARNLTHTLGAWLRSNVAIAPLPAGQQVFSRVAEDVKDGCYVLPLRVRMDSQQARGMLSFSLTLAPAVIDLLLGGSGRTASAGKDLTEIEEAVLGSVLEFVLREWTTAWSPYDAEFQPETRDHEGSRQRLMPLQERVLCCRFQVAVAELTGEMLFCLPSAVVTSAMRAASHQREQQRQRTSEERNRMLHRLRSAKTLASLHFPAMQLRATDLRSLLPGSVLPLPLTRNTQAELRVAGMGVFRAAPVRSGDHRAAQIVQALNFTKEEIPQV